MADFHFEVDTTPMAQSVSTVQGHVAGVAAAVTAMEAAVIATEREAAQRICDNADLGFMILIRSQVSQKLVAAQSEMNSRLMTLVELSKAIDTVMRQMESDYNMIKRRYTKLFRALDRALETRVRELDRPAMQLNEIKRNIIFDKLKDESSLLLDSSNEVITLEQTALAGKLKQKTRDTVRTLSDSIQNSRAYN
ncbi:MAG: hypothetical protein LBR16_08435, partial [Treponema sp.]|nr:hypothetical protein [Treponema sp.]